MPMKSASQCGACTSAGRFTDYQLICQQKWEGISAAQFADWQLICQQIWRQKICWQEGFFYWQIYWLSVNLPADFGENVRISPGRNGETGISASRFTDCQLICQQILGRQEICLPKSGISADRFTDCQLFCQQIWRVRKSSGRNGGIFLQADLLSASRLTHYQLICWQILRRQSENMLKEMGRQVFLPENLLTVKNSASRLWGDRKSASKNRRFLQTDILTVS